jgi:hypothetical protein
LPFVRDKRHEKLLKRHESVPKPLLIPSRIPEQRTGKV